MDKHDTVLQSLIEQQRILNVKRTWAVTGVLPADADNIINDKIQQFKQNKKARTQQVIESAATTPSVLDVETPHGCNVITNSRGNVQFVCNSFSPNALSTSSVVFGCAHLVDDKISLRASFTIKSNYHGIKLKEPVIVRGPIYHADKGITVETAKSVLKNNAVAILFGAYIRIISRLRLKCHNLGLLQPLYSGCRFDETPSNFTLPNIPEYPSSCHMPSEFNISKAVNISYQFLEKALFIELPNIELPCLEEQNESDSSNEEDSSSSVDSLSD